MTIAHTQRMWAIASMVALVGLLVAVSAGAATTADVAATVTTKLISVTVADGSVAYGIMDLNTSKDTVGTDTQTATNNGNVTANLGIRSSDAVSGGTTWQLAAAAGADAFYHAFSTNAGTTWTAFNPDNVTYSTLQAGVASGGTKTFDLKITTPTSSTDSVQHTITVTVQATE